jgi:predicted nucleic acid-binding Zn ribbon protein
MSNPYSSPARPGSFFKQQDEGVSNRTAEVMSRTKGWVRFFAILFFLGTAVSIFQVVVYLISPETLNHRSVTQAFSTGQATGNLIVGLLYLFIGIRLNGYANCIGNLLRTGSARDLEAALEQHRGFWKIVGVFMLIGVIFFLVLIPIVTIRLIMRARESSMEAKGEMEKAQKQIGTTK